MPGNQIVAASLYFGGDVEMTSERNWRSLLPKHQHQLKKGSKRSVLQKVLFTILAIFFVFGSAINTVLLWMTFKKVKGPSPIVFLPGIVGVAAFYLSPYPYLRHCVWLPLLIDPGCAFYVIFAFVGIVPEIYAASKFFELARFESCKQNDLSILISLYSGGKYIVKHRAYNTRRLISHINTWSLENSRLKLTLGGKLVEYSVVREDDNETHLYWVPDSESSFLDKINLKQVSGKELK